MNKVPWGDQNFSNQFMYFCIVAFMEVIFMKKLLLNVTFVALALGSHGYAMQPEDQSTSFACLSTTDEKMPQTAPTSRIKPAIMAAGITSASLVALSLLASQASISDIMFPANAEQASGACWFNCADAHARVNNIYLAQRCLSGALAAGLVAGGVTYADVKGKIGTWFKKIASLFKQDKPAVETPYSPDQQQAISTAINQLVNFARAAGQQQKSLQDSEELPEQPGLDDDEMDNLLLDSPYRPTQEAVITLDSFLDDYIQENTQKFEKTAGQATNATSDKTVSKKESSQQMHRMLRTNLIDQKLIEAQLYAIVAQYSDAYAIVPATPSTVVAVPVSEPAPAVSQPVSSTTSATVSSQTESQPAPTVAAPAPVIEDAKEQERVEQKAEPVVLQQNIATLTPEQRAALSSMTMPLAMFMRAAYAPQEQRYTKPELQSYFNGKMAELGRKHKAAQTEAQKTALVEKMREIVKSCNTEEQKYLKKMAKKETKNAKK